MVLCWIFFGSLQLLNSAHVRERGKALLRNVPCWVGSGVSLFLADFVVLQMVIFWECTFPPLLEIREIPEFHDLMTVDKGRWPRCLLWHGSLPLLSGVNGASLGS